MALSSGSRFLVSVGWLGSMNPAFVNSSMSQSAASRTQCSLSHSPSSRASSKGRTSASRLELMATSPRIAYHLVGGGDCDLNYLSYFHKSRQRARVSLAIEEGNIFHPVGVRVSVSHTSTILICDQAKLTGVIILSALGQSKSHHPESVSVANDEVLA